MGELWVVCCEPPTIRDPTRKQTRRNATLVRMEPQPDFMCPHHCRFATAKRHIGYWDGWPGGTSVSQPKRAPRLCVVRGDDILHPQSGHSYRWASSCIGQIARPGAAGQSGHMSPRAGRTTDRNQIDVQLAAAVIPPALLPFAITAA